MWKGCWVVGGEHNRGCRKEEAIGCGVLLNLSPPKNTRTEKVEMTGAFLSGRAAVDTAQEPHARNAARAGSMDPSLPFTR